VAVTFTRDDVERIARLARLDLTEDEKISLTRQLANFLAYADQVRALDTTGIPPTSHPPGPSASWRDDAPEPSLQRAEALAQAPEADADAGLFKVPRVLG
jgi:aspartyl-tRNA(Asn)/glutamyl-tRNA(Gln) amidotransferase subunit C